MGPQAKSSGSRLRICSVELADSDLQNTGPPPPDFFGLQVSLYFQKGSGLPINPQQKEAPSTGSGGWDISGYAAIHNKEE